MCTDEGYLLGIKQHASVAITLLVRKLAYYIYYIVIKLYITSKWTNST